MFVFSPLPNPYLVAITPAVATLTSISAEMLQSDFFLYMFSGNTTDFSEFITMSHANGSASTETADTDSDTNPDTENSQQDKGKLGLFSWATPYALSIYGRELYENCPFGEKEKMVK